MTVLQPGDRPKTGTPPPEENAMITPHKRIPFGIEIAISGRFLQQARKISTSMDCSNRNHWSSRRNPTKAKAKTTR